jgi:hypothetical protein
MKKTEILVIKYDEQNWDIVTHLGAFAYGYFDTEVGCMKVQYHDQRINIPIVSYDGLISYVMREECDEELHENYTMMSSEIFEQTAKYLLPEGQPFDVKMVQLSEDSFEKREEIAKALINEFLFGKIQKQKCSNCEKKQVYYVDSIEGKEAKYCTECKTKIEGE